MEELNDVFVENIRFAIVKQAIADYTKALRFLRDDKNKEKYGEYEYNKRKASAKSTKDECERFF